MANKRTTKKSAKKEVTKAAVSTGAEKAKAKTTAAAPAVEEVKAAPVEKAPRARKTAEKKPADDKFIIQGSNGEYTMSDVVEVCKTAYRNGTRKQVKSCAFTSRLKTV